MPRPFQREASLFSLTWRRSISSYRVFRAVDVNKGDTLPLITLRRRGTARVIHQTSTRRTIRELPISAASSVGRLPSGRVSLSRERYSARSRFASFRGCLGYSPDFGIQQIMLVNVPALAGIGSPDLTHTKKRTALVEDSSSKRDAQCDLKTFYLTPIYRSMCTNMLTPHIRA